MYAHFYIVHAIKIMQNDCNFVPTRLFIADNYTIKYGVVILGVMVRRISRIDNAEPISGRRQQKRLERTKEKKILSTFPSSLSIRRYQRYLLHIMEIFFFFFYYKQFLSIFVWGFAPNSHGAEQKQIITIQVYINIMYP